MTAVDFRRMALRFPEATEGAHMNHPDFRVRGKIFATLGYPDKGVGMVKLFPDQQQQFVRAEPKVFAPVNGLWGRRGVSSSTRHRRESTETIHFAPSRVGDL